MTDHQLLPCPFCGAKAYLDEHYWAFGNKYDLVKCTDCGITSACYGEKTIEKWNTRAALSGGPEISHSPVDAKTFARPVGELPTREDGRSGSLENAAASPSIPEGWQPIDTCPQGVHVLFCIFPVYRVFTGLKNINGDFSIGVCLHCMEYNYCKPTHWQPLPQPPQSQIAEPKPYEDPQGAIE